MKPDKAVIVTLQRTGGTFLAGCLSNHPDIFCDRGEPLAERSQWAVAAPDEVARLDLILSLQYYRVAMCKLINSHAFRPRVWSYLTAQSPPVKVLYLRRENILDQAISHEINAGKRLGTVQGHPTHIFQDGVDLSPCCLDPESVYLRCEDEIGRYHYAETKLAEGGFPVLQLTYEEITGNQSVEQIPEAIGRRICGFLGVDYVPLAYNARKVHHQPWSSLLLNWHNIVKRIRSTEYERYLEDGWLTQP